MKDIPNLYLNLLLAGSRGITLLPKCENGGSHNSNLSYNMNMYTP